MKSLQKKLHKKYRSKAQKRAEGFRNVSKKGRMFMDKVYQTLTTEERHKVEKYMTI
ncbi:hypothetical protein [Aureibacter tunicatorum]|uniref:Uncharacterized protein n=1 Tax=Aureibacter tunicatorum TaxID=866807 RepID=A0AAE3XMB1_9BACT|nr:hypothetical protein [Aureibacter tunicatorum]MDR6237574.1 hypothetical protein [Aureibacter tunicatorum]BDD02608.1 hypothetical protein AUTU_00910 [Aureibacter tunicatorum]